MRKKINETRTSEILIELKDLQEEIAKGLQELEGMLGE